MSVKATNQVTISQTVDVSETKRYYKMASSTPEKPTANPPTGWSSSEPAFDPDTTINLYFVDLTVYSDDTFVYSDVSLSSAYTASREAAKTATNYMDFDEEIGLMVGRKNADGDMQKNVTIDSTGISIKMDPWTEVARFESDKVELGKNMLSNVTEINMLDGGFTLRARRDDPLGNNPSSTVSHIRSPGYMYLTGNVGVSIGEDYTTPFIQNIANNAVKLELCPYDQNGPKRECYMLLKRSPAGSGYNNVVTVQCGTDNNDSFDLQSGHVTTRAHDVQVTASSFVTVNTGHLTLNAPTYTVRYPNLFANAINARKKPIVLSAGTTESGIPVPADFQYANPDHYIYDGTYYMPGCNLLEFNLRGLGGAFIDVSAYTDENGVQHLTQKLRTTNGKVKVERAAEKQSAGEWAFTPWLGDFVLDIGTGLSFYAPVGETAMFEGYIQASGSSGSNIGTGQFIFSSTGSGSTRYKYLDGNGTAQWTITNHNGSTEAASYLSFAPLNNAILKVSLTRKM